MRVCVVGAGAIGGLLGVRIALAGHEVSVLARGAHLAAIKQHGLKLIQDGEEHVANNLFATDDLGEMGEQDVLLLGLKSHQIEPIAQDLADMLGPRTSLVTLQNGIPWWYFQKNGGDYEGQSVKAVDPHGVLAQSLDPDRILGCIAYPAAEITQPGVIRHVEGLRFPVGELDGSDSERVNAVSALFIEAGFKAPVLPDIRSEIWLKLWGNLTFNPISALTHATLEDICVHPPSRKLAATMMAEAQIVGEKLGATFRVPLEKRIEGAQKVGKHKTSMLQDVEAGKPLEFDGMLGAVVELGELTGTPVPTLTAIYEAVSLLNRTIRQEGLCIKGESP